MVREIELGNLSVGTVCDCQGEVQRTAGWKSSLRIGFIRNNWAI
jgi:hypothetical protein